MSYFSNIEDASLEGLACGPTCSCGPCKSGISGFSEWYVREGEEKAKPRTTSSANQRLHGLAQPRGPVPQPVFPHPPPVPMPTNPLIPKEWCPELGKIKSTTCFPYAPHEIAVSRTAAGHLTPDVVLIQPSTPVAHIKITCGYLIIRDFGVDWRHVKLAARNEQLFKDSVNRFETDKSLFFRIVGYSDCLGIERNNFLLRRGRARNIFRLLGPSARSRVMSVKAAPRETYLTDNSTVAARAGNRAVVIEFVVSSPQTI